MKVGSAYGSTQKTLCPRNEPAVPARVTSLRPGPTFRYDPDYEMNQSIVIDDDAYVYSFTPHMHFRGKRMRFYATFPGWHNRGNAEHCQLQLQLATRLHAERAALRARRDQVHCGWRIRQLGTKSDESRSHPVQCRGVCRAWMKCSSAR